MSRYEVVFVLRPDLGQSGTDEQVERIRRVLAEQGAKDIAVHDWGARDLAFRIETHRRGHFFAVEYEGTAAAVGEVERNLKISDQVLRFTTVRQTEGGMPPSAFVPQPRPPRPETGAAPAEPGAPDSRKGEA